MKRGKRRHDLTAIDIDHVARETGIHPYTVRKVLKQIIEYPRLSKEDPPLEGMIHIRAAVRKYRIPLGTIQGWIRRKFLPEPERHGQYAYIDEASLVKLAQAYQPGRGRRNISNLPKN